jgi:AAHS family 3-hydroxyphenylpropionic acid transporter
MPAGGALASLFSYGLANLAHWPAMYYLGAALPLLAIPGLALGPKSPRREPSGRATAKPAVAEALFGQSRAARTAILWMTFLSALSIQYIMINWLPSLLISKGLLRPQASIVQIGYNLFGAMGSVGVGLLIDRTHRSTATALVFLASIVCLAVLAAAPGVLTICLAIGCLVGCAISATQAIVYALAPSAYPASMRGTGVGFALAAGRIGAAIGPLLAGAVIGAGAGPAQVLGLMVPLLALAGLGAWMINREPSIAA